MNQDTQVLAASSDKSASRPHVGNTVVSLTLFKIVWLAVVASAIWSLPWLGVVAVAGFLLYQITVAGQRNLLGPALLVGIAGYSVDTAYVWSGLLSFPGQSVLPAPPWMALLWVNFALIMETGLAWLQGRPLLASALGAVGGPAAYSAGVGFGLIELSVSAPVAYSVIALTWALCLPALIGSVRFWPAGSERADGPLAGA